MQMSGSMALCSTSPPATIWSSQIIAPQSCPISPSMFEVDNHTRTGRGGLSSLFYNHNCRVSSSGAMMEGMETSCLASSMEDRFEGTESYNLAGKIWSGKTRDRSPSSVLHMPLSHGRRYFPFLSKESASSASGILALDHHLGSSWRRSLPSSEGFEAKNAVRIPLWEVNSNCWGSEISENEIVSDLKEFPPSIEPFSLDDLKDIGLPDADDLFFSFESEAVNTTEPHEVLEPDEDLPSSQFSEDWCLIQAILLDAQCRHKIFSEDLVIKAFKVAETAHRGQLRRNGDMYLVHCVETALILASAGADSTIVAAGLLHDIIDDSSCCERKLRNLFGVDIADLVLGVSKLSAFSQLARDNNIASNTLEADRLRTMFLAMVDVRVVLIKLADRLHNLRTLDALPEEKQRSLARETLEIFAPIANRLGIWRWKAEMEDICFKNLNPQEYEELATRLAESCREGVVMSAVQSLDQALHDEGLEFDDLCGRSKSLFSIFRKMSKKGLGIHEIYDVRGLRLIVPDKQSCYAALDIVHKLWHQHPGKFKDYIQLPKANGYQSLHTVVLGEDGLPLEVQIRTPDMHHHAEFGMAAHWRYKEGNDKHSSFILQRVEWARWLLTWHSELIDTKLRVSASDLDLRPPCPFPVYKSGCPCASYSPPQSDDDPLFIIMLEGKKMIVQELPPGSTAADLLLERSSLSNGLLHPSEFTPIVNQKIVNIQEKLRMGDLVELVTCASESTIRVEESDFAFTQRIYPYETDIHAYREKIRRMYEDSGKCDGQLKGVFHSQKSRDMSMQAVL